MKSMSTNLFIHSHERGSLTRKMRDIVAPKQDAKWVIVTRSEYRRLQAMQGLLLLVLLLLTGVMFG